MIIIISHLLICIVFSELNEPSIDVSTSIVKYWEDVKGVVLGYSEATNQLRVLGGMRPFVSSINIITDSILYDESVNINTNNISLEWDIQFDEPIISSIISNRRWSCKTQCAAQINNLLYIVRPNLFSDLGQPLRQSTIMAIFDVDSKEYIEAPDIEYQFNVPNASSPGALDDSTCVVTNNIILFVFAAITSQNLDIDLVNPNVICPDEIGDDNNKECPVTEIFAYNTITDNWTIRGELSQPIIQRYQIGCAISPNNEYIYIFGGSKVIDAISQPGDQTENRTERYDIINDEWEILPSIAQLNEARFGLFSFVSSTDNAIYLYGGFRYDPVLSIPQQQLDASNMAVFDISTPNETMLNLNDAQPGWNIGHSRFSLSNTLRINNVCQNEIGISVGSFDFNSSQEIDDIQILRFGDIYDYYSNDALFFEDFTEYDNDIVDIQDAIFDPYRQNIFNFTITVTNGYDFIPNDNINNYDVIITNWEGQTFNIQQLNERYTSGRNGRRNIINIDIESENINLFNKCNGVSNIIARLNIGIVIRGIRRRNRQITSLCGQNRASRLRNWFFKDSNTGNNIPGAGDAKIQLQIFELIYSLLITNTISYLYIF